MHHSEKDGLRLDNSCAQSFVDVHFAPEGKTHANFDNSNDNFNNNNISDNNDNFNNNEVTVESSGGCKPEFYGIVDEEMPGRGKFVSSPSLTLKSNDSEGNFVIEDRKSSKRGSKSSIEDYYQKYSVQTAKILINTLFLPSQKICQACAPVGKSVVYSDRLVYENRLLEGRHLDYFSHFHTEQLFFRKKSFRDDNRDYMPIINVSKTNHSGLSHSQDLEPADIFNFKTLEPDILLIDSGNDIDAEDDNKLGKSDYFTSYYSNTDYYHRRMIDGCSRISRIGIFRPKVFQNINLEVRSRTGEVKDPDCDDEIQYWMDFNEDTKLLSSKNSNEMFNLSAARLHNHNYNPRASLLMLEPILMMPELAEDANKRRSNKKRITRSEHVKIVRIVIAYTLSFFLLAIVTFYIVYFV